MIPPGGEWISRRLKAVLAEEAYDEVTARDPYVHRTPITMSMLGKCRRQAAYALRDGWPAQVKTTGSAQAYIGTAIHRSLLVDLGEYLNGAPEVPVALDVEGVEISGTCDLVLETSTLDLKTVSQWYYSVVQERVPVANVLQVTGYALATGKDWATLLYVNRSDGERFAITWPAKQHAEELATWVRESTGDPELTPRDQRGPGLSFVCDECPFVLECWGPVEEQQKPQGTIANEEGIELAVEEYAAAREREKAAKGDREFWREALVGATSGPYGRWKLSWSKPRPRQVPDLETAKALLEAEGYEWPMKTVTSDPSISVTSFQPKV